MKMMKTIAICVALVAGPALAAEAPSFVVAGAAGECGGLTRISNCPTEEKK
jgi:hypothetical protein